MSARIGISGERLTFPTYVDRVIIPTEQVKTLFSTPLVIVPGDPRWCPVIRYFSVRKAAGIAYTLNGNTTLTFQFKNPNTTTRTTGLNWVLTNWLDQATEQFVLTRGYNGIGTGNYVGASNNIDSWGASIILALNTADMTVGDGALDVKVIWEGLPKQIPWF